MNISYLINQTIFPEVNFVNVEMDLKVLLQCLQNIDSNVGNFKNINKVSFLIYKNIYNCFRHFSIDMCF